MGDLVSGAIEADSSFEVNHDDSYCCRVDREDVR